MHRVIRHALIAVLALTCFAATAQERSLTADAHLIPRETAPDGEGYFSIVEGRNGRLYIGTHANAVNSWLVEFDPAAGEMRIVVDAHQAIGTTVTGFGAQAKIHTRNNVGSSGRIYFATKQGYPAKDEKRIAYPGGYPMTYDPATGEVHVYPIPIPHQGIISIAPDESRGLAYLSTCSDARPIESTHFMVLDLKTEQYTDLLDAEHVYAFIVIDHLGRAYHPLRGGGIARYVPETKSLERLTQTIDGQPPSPESHLADENSHPINWEVSPDRRTLYAVAMSGNALYAYDLTAEGTNLPGRTVGPLLGGRTGTDCRAMSVGPDGIVWAAVTVRVDGKPNRRPHLVRFDPARDAKPVDLDVITVANPDFTTFVDEAGKPLPFHGGFPQLESGETIPQHVLQGVCESTSGDVYVLALHPYTLLRIPAEQVKAGER